MENMRVDEACGLRVASKTKMPNHLTKRKYRWTKERTLGLIFVLIPILSFLFFNGFTVVLSFVLQFCSMDAFDLSSIKWNNFENFQFIYSNERFWHSVKITVWLYSAQLVSLLIALIVSTLLHRGLIGSKLLQIMYFIPYICSTVAVGIMWNWMYHKDLGMVNWLLGTDINWLYSALHPEYTTWAIFIAVAWQAPGYGIVIYKAAHDAISPSLYEAATVDGANELQMFFSITLPSLRRTTFYLASLGIISGLFVYDVALIMAPSTWTQTAGEGDAALSLMYYVHILGKQQMNMEYASIVSWFLFVVAAILFTTVQKIGDKVSKDI